MVTIQSLSEDLIYSISCHLSPQDISAFRVTCRNMNAKTFRVFKRVCFERLWVTITQKRIEELTCIAKHDLFGPEVCKLVICTLPHPYDNLIADVDLIDALAEAMGHLRNCKTIIFSNSNALLRLKPPVNMAFGLPTFSSPNEGLFDEDFFALVLHATITAVKIAEMPVEEFGIHLHDLEETIGSNEVPYHVLDPPPEQAIRFGTPRKLMGVTTLRLLVPQPLYGIVPDWNDRLCYFLELFPGVSHLHLTHDKIHSDARWRPALTSLQLQKLDLGSLSVSEGELLELLLHHQSTLEEVTFREININTYVSIDASQKGWSTMLENMQKLPRIHRVDLIECAQIKYWVKTTKRNFLIESGDDFRQAIAKLKAVEATEREYQTDDDVEDHTDDLAGDDEDFHI